MPDAKEDQRYRVIYAGKEKEKDDGDLATVRPARKRLKQGPTSKLIVCLVPTSGYHKSIFSPFAHLFSNPSSLQPSTEQACRQQPGNIFLFFGSYRQQQAVSHKQPPLVGRGFEIFARSVDFVTSIGFQADESAAASVATRGPWPRCRTFGVTENLEDMLKPWPWFVSCLRGKANFKCALLSGPVLYSSVRTEETA